MISKELLSEVTGIPENAIQAISIGKSIVSARKINGIVEEHNIYELAHKCKELALDKGYDICSGINFAVIQTEEEGIIWNTTIEENESEPEAIFKACQWILDNAKG